MSLVPGRPGSTDRPSGSTPMHNRCCTAWIAAALLMFLVVGAQSRAQAPVSVGGTVFEDTNGNGRRDSGERGIAGVAVSNQREVVKSGSDGVYRVAGPGYGVVFVSVPDGYRSVGPFWQPAPASTTGVSLDFGLTVQRTPAEFSFIHASDTHVSQQSLERLRQFRSIAEARRPDFVLVSGDLVRDALRVGEEEARGYYDLYLDETRRFPMPVWSVPGNHENFGIERHLSLVSTEHPLYGKGMYRQRLGPNYYSFTFGGVHFVGLDTVDIADLWYYGHVDDAQLAWLRADLESVPAGTPVVTFNHIPFVSAVDMTGGYRDDGAGADPHQARRPDRLPAHRLELQGCPAGVTAARLDAGARRAFSHARVHPLRIGRSHTVPSGSGRRWSHRRRRACDLRVTLYRVKNGVIDDGEFIPLR